MEQIDLKLKLFGGIPIHAEGYGEIVPLKIRKIIDVGYSEYMKHLNMLTLEVKDFLPEGTEEDIDVFDLIIQFGGDEIEKIFVDSLSLLLNGDALIDKENHRALVKHSNEQILVVNKDNYSAIQEIIKWQNYINHFDEKNLGSFNPADEEARKLREKLDKLQKQIDEIKKKQDAGDKDDENDIDFFDILSAISSKSFGVNELNVMDMTIYQVYSKFKRLEIIDQYEISIKSIMAGAKDVKLKHWSSKG
jgi:hypothetical protein